MELHGARRNCRVGAVFTVMAFCMVLAGSVCFAQVQVKASLDSTTVYVNQQARLTVKVTVKGNDAPKPKLPRIEHIGFSEVGGTQISQSWINGDFSLTETYTYWVMADQPGEYPLYPITVEYEGRTFVSNKVMLKVLEEGRPMEEAPDYFLKAEVDRDTVYVNEPVLVTFTQYSRLKPTSQFNLDLDTSVFKGFWNEVIKKERLRYERKMVGGAEYYAVELQQVLLFPLTTGEVTIEPIQLTSVLEKPGRRQRSIFGFGQREGVKVQMRSNPVKLNVLPLPQKGRPENFSGAVGVYDLSASVDKNEVKAGETLTLKISIRGRGNLKNLPAPELPPLKGFDEPYASPKKEHVSIENGTMMGGVDFEFILVPRSTEVESIGPVEFNYFNTALKQYMKEKTDPIAIKVLPSKHVDEETIVIGSGQRRREIQVIGEDLRYIHTGEEAIRPKSDRNGRLVWLAALHAVPLVLVVAAYGWMFRRRKREEDPLWAARMDAPGKARRNLKQCRQLMEQGQAEEFYALLQKTLYDFFTPQLQASMAGMTSEQRYRLLTEKFGQERAEKIEQIHSACDEARFAPGASQRETMSQLLVQARELIK